MDMLFFLASAIIAGFIVGRLVNRLKLPGVVGYLIAGLILGPSFFNVFNFELLAKLSIFTSFALSLVAFAIGSEMKLDTLKELGRGIGVIILSESFGAFLVVALGVYLLTGKLYMALVFGAIAPASAPAGTVAVLQENKAKGRLTNALYAVVGLDDGLAIVIFAFAIALAKILFTGGDVSVAAVLQGPVLEIIGSVILGGIIGVFTGYFANKVFGEDNILAVALGGILICAGLANYLHFSLILANLSLGMAFVNLFPVANRKVCRPIQYISLPAYIIFFFIAGAHLQIKLLPSMGVLGIVYIICRTFGLMGGSFIGAASTRQNPIIRNWLGFGILSQAGVAIGLAVLATTEFALLGQAGRDLGVVIMNTVAASTIIFEIIGPIGARLAISKAGEIGANVTEEDLIETYSVADVMDTKVPVVPTGTSLSEVIKIVSNTESFYYPVVDTDQKLIGVITLDGIRNTFSTQQLNDWLVALDIAEPVVAVTTPQTTLSEALEKTKRLDTEYLPVVASQADAGYAGLLNCRGVHRLLSAEVLSRQQKADSIQRAANP
jgi:Kef-type K+ transport system membrane component KefB